MANLPPAILRTSAQRQQYVIPKNYIVIEQDTGLQYYGDGSTLGGLPTGLTQLYNLKERMRRAASASRHNNLIDNPAMANPPNVTTSGGYLQTVNYFFGTSGQLTNMDRVNIVGGVPFCNLTSYVAVHSVTANNGSNIGPSGYYQNGWYAETMTDSPNITFSFFRTAESGCMVAVSENGAAMQYVSSSPIGIYLGSSACSSNTGAVTVAFGSSKVRRVRFEFGNQQSDEPCGGAGGILNLRGFFIDPSYSIWKPKDSDVINAAFVGDSYTAGAPRDSGMQAVNWARICAAKLGWRPVQMALGTTGYSAANGALAPASSPVRLNDLKGSGNLTFDVFVFALGTNDVSGNNGTAVVLPDLQAKALTCFQAARAANPIAPIIVVGPWPRATFPAATQAAQASGVRAAFNQFNDPNSLFIPIYDDPNGNWMPGTSYQGSTPFSSGDTSGRYIWTDGIHPIYAGHYYYGSRVAESIRDWLMTF